MSILFQNVAKFGAIATLLFIGTAFVLPQPAAAAYGIPTGGVELAGFAWSAYDIDPSPATSLAGIGWISMNCSNTGTCATSNYAVRFHLYPACLHRGKFC